jgi:hypothetical protein
MAGTNQGQNWTLEQRAESREQRAESREQRAESREPGAAEHPFARIQTGQRI